MRRPHYCLLLPLLLGLGSAAGHGSKNAQQPRYAIAFTNLGPLNSDIFIAAADGSGARPLLPHPGLDYNASFSADATWIVFTSTRNGSADIYRVHPDGSGLARLTDHEAFDDQGAMSPDGKSLAFVSSRSGQADIWVLEIASRAVRNLTHHPSGDFRPSWSPDGQWIAFSTDRNSNWTGLSFVKPQRTDVFVVRADGSALRRLTQADSSAGSPTWSADGKRLLYYEASRAAVASITNVRRGDASRLRPASVRATTQIVSTNVVTNERQVLTTGEGEKWSPRVLADGRIGYASGGPEGGVEFVSGAAGARGEVRSPSWSPDGKRMVFHRDVESRWPPFRDVPSRDPVFRLMRTGSFPAYSPRGDRLLVNDQTAGGLQNSLIELSADGSRWSVLFKDSTRNALAPVWSPQGDRIAFAMGGFFQRRTPALAIADLAVIRADGTGLKVLTDGTGNYGFPSWSPDGRQLVYRVMGREQNGLSIMDLETRVVRVLTTGTSYDNFPSWSPKGDRIAFTTNRDGGDYEIYTIRPDGTDLKRLTRTPGNDSHNSFSADGEWIAFTSARGGFKDESALHAYNPQPYGDIYVMRADGSDVRMLTDDQLEDGTPSWLPNARTRIEGAFPRVDAVKRLPR